MKKSVKITLAVVCIGIVLSGLVWQFFGSNPVMACQPDALIQVVDENGSTYSDFSMCVSGQDKTYTVNAEGIHVQELGLEEGTYTINITEVNGKKTDIVQKINVGSNNSGTEQDEAAHQVLISTKEEMSDEDLYRPLLLQYVQSFREKWNQKQLQAENICTLFDVLYNQSEDAGVGLKEVGFSIQDVNDDGTKELFIYSINEPTVIYSAYTICDHEVTMLYQVNTFGEVLKCSDKGVLLWYVDSLPTGLMSGNGENYTEYFLRITNGKLEGIGGVAKSDEKVWKVSRDENGSLAEEIAMDEFDALQKQYQPVEMAGLTLSEYPCPDFTEKAEQSEKSAPAESESKVEFPKTFILTSGMGAWGTTLTINEDGSFYGEYSDQNLGENGSNYPKGTWYLSKFTGKLSNPEMTDDRSYTYRISELNIEGTVGDSYIENQMRFVVSEPKGLKKGDDIKICLPGTNMADLSKSFIRSYCAVWMTEETEGVLPDGIWAFINVSEDEGFVSSKND